jgi:hypothetical protein
VLSVAAPLRRCAKGSQAPMAAARKRNPLLPWIIGLALIAVVDIYVGYLFFATSCAAPALAQFLVLVAVPGIYLALMYVTLRSQE